MWMIIDKKTLVEVSRKNSMFKIHQYDSVLTLLEDTDRWKRWGFNISI